MFVETCLGAAVSGLPHAIQRQCEEQQLKPEIERVVEWFMVQILLDPVGAVFLPSELAGGAAVVAVEVAVLDEITVGWDDGGVCEERIVGRVASLLGHRVCCIRLARGYLKRKYTFVVRGGNGGSPGLESPRSMACSYGVIFAFRGFSVPVS